MVPYQHFLLHFQPWQSVLLFLTYMYCMLFVGYFKMSGKVVHTIQNQHGTVIGIAALNDHLYVSSTKQIAVYCPTTFQFQQHLNLQCGSCGIQSNTLPYCDTCSVYQPLQLLNMVGCSANNCLYTSEQTYHYICKIALGQNDSLSLWSLGGGSPQGLSVTSSHNLLVAPNDANYVYEYSTDGKLIRQINLQPAGICSPVHAVQLSDDHYGVTHQGPAHQFSIVSSDGQLVRSYRGDARDLNEPRGIAVDDGGRVFVADHHNNRILVINHKTLSAYPLRLPDYWTLDGPYSILFDSVNKRLYIGEWNGGRVICCKI